MKTSSFPQWRGFELAPQGCLLEQVVDMSTDMGIAYERSCDFYKDFHTHDRLMVVLPRTSCTMEVRSKSPKMIFRVDSATLLIVPQSLEHDDEGKSAIYDTVALYPSEDLLLDAGQKEGLTAKEIKNFKKKALKLKRSSWLDQLVQQYFFDRVVLKKNDGLEFFEQNIVKEIFRIAGLSPKRIRASLPEDGKTGVAERAIEYIEGNLFADLELETVAKNARASTSTLLRRFKASTHKTPHAYIKSRRMEEAMRLLKTGAYGVGEIAILVGYANFGAFTDAFKSEFRKTPSHFLQKDKNQRSKS